MERVIAFLLFTGLLIFIYYRWMYKRERKVKEVLEEDFSARWREILKKHVGFYISLNKKGKIRFERLVQLFLAEKNIYGINTEIDDTTRILVASSAVIPIWGFGDYHYPHVKEICVVDGAVAEVEVEKGKVKNIIAGQVKPGARAGSCSLTLSKSSLVQGFNNMNDRKNVGIHEFAHVLDHQDGAVDGVPDKYLPDELLQPWSNIMYQKIEEIKKGKNNINPYGATNEAEFFAVATEYFFEKPNLLKEKHPELYGLLTEVFKQEPHKQYPKSFKNVLKPYGRKIGRNDPCLCGSGKKYKECCIDK